MRPSSWFSSSSPANPSVAFHLCPSSPQSPRFELVRWVGNCTLRPQSSVPPSAKQCYHAALYFEVPLSMAPGRTDVDSRATEVRHHLLIDFSSFARTYATASQYRCQDISKYRGVHITGTWAHHTVLTRDACAETPSVPPHMCPSLPKTVM